MYLLVSEIKILCRFNYFNYRVVGRVMVWNCQCCQPNTILGTLQGTLLFTIIIL